MLYRRLRPPHHNPIIQHHFPRLESRANWFKFKRSMLGTYAQELHALRAELQSTLARLGMDPVAATSDEETRPASRLERRQRPITRWNRRQLTQELAAASERRRELERQLQREMQRHREADDQQQQTERRGRRRTAWQAAIAELQQQQVEIRRQIEAETVDVVHTQDGGSGQDQDAERQQDPHPARSAVDELVSETHYSIGGVVTLEPLSSLQQVAVLGTSRSRLQVQSAAAAAPALPSVLESAPRYRQPPDALNDVFSLQLKFAETMLKLEKSVQMRDQLLHGGTTTMKRRTATQTREVGARVRRQSGRQLSHRRRSVSGSNSDSSAMYREGRSSESFSSSAYSFSSLDSTPHRGQTIRVRYPNFGVSRATTAETVAPSSTGAFEANAVAPPVSSSTTTTLLPHEYPDTLREAALDRRSSDTNHAAPSEPADERHEEIHRTPTTGSSVTTPTTGSDQKSTTSSSKQVRFGDDAYSTPVLARKFNFDNPSIDEDDYEEKEDESLLSFLGGSSVTSAELNDASFLRAFDRFRRELNVTKHNSAMQSPVLARKLFPALSIAFPPKSSEGAEKAQPVPGEALVTEPSSSVPPDDQSQTARFPALGGLGVSELKERRRQLCLDIQAESAQLVLNFGAMQSVTAGSQDAVHTKDRLLVLRDELQVVDKRIKELQ